MSRKQAQISIRACFCVALASSIIQILRHFMIVKDHADPEAVPDGHMPFYGNKVGHCISSEQCQNR
jgi:hypothetical protein